MIATCTLRRGAPWLVSLLILAAWLVLTAPPASGQGVVDQANDPPARQQQPPLPSNWYSMFNGFLPG